MLRITTLIARPIVQSWNVLKKVRFWNLSLEKSARDQELVVLVTSKLSLYLVSLLLKKCDLAYKSLYRRPHPSSNSHSMFSSYLIGDGTLRKTTAGNPLW